MADIIKHTDIAEEGVMKPFQTELYETIKILNTLDSDIIKIATDLKKALGDNNFTSTEAINKFSKQVVYSNEVLNQHTQIKNNLIKTEAMMVNVITESNKELIEHKIALDNSAKAVKENVKLQSDYVGAYEKLNIALNRNKKEYKDLFIAQKEGSVRAKELKVAIDQMEKSIRSADYAVHQHQRNVGNYSSGFNSLNNSINQISREMPAFANSVQTGFMAISNNLPILIDSVTQLKQRNIELNAEGKASISIWKQVGSALFSLQTGFSILITLLTVFGAELVKGIGNLFKAEDATLKLKEAQDELNKSLKEGLDAEKDLNDYIAMTLDSETKIKTIKAKLRGASVREIKDIEEKGIKTRIRLAYDQEVRAIDILAGVRAKASSLEAEQVTKLSDEEYKKLVEDNNRRIEEAEAYYKQISDIRVKIENGAGVARQQAKADIIEDDKKTVEERRKLAEEALKKRQEEWLKELELQHQVNIEQIMTYEDNNVRKIALIQENLLYEKSVNEIKIEDTKRRLAIELSLTKQADNEIKELIKNRTKIDEVNAIDQNPELLKKAQKFLVDKRKKEEVEELKFRQTLLGKTTQIVKSELDKQNALKMKSIDADIAASQRREDIYRQMAENGSQTAQNNIAFEMRKQAELQAQKDKIFKRELQQKRAIAILEAISNGNPNGRTGVNNLINSLPSYKDGTENTGDVSNPLDGDGGRLSVIHRRERIFTAEQNKKIGNMSNETAANILNQFQLINPNQFMKMPMANLVNDDRQINKLDEVKNEIAELKAVIKSQPIKDQAFDEVNKMIVTTIKTSGRTEITRHKPRFNG
jgi:hypothetical protein